MSTISPCIKSTTLPNGDLLSYGRQKMNPGLGPYAPRSTFYIPQVKAGTSTGKDNGTAVTWSVPTVQITIDMSEIGPAMSLLSIRYTLQNTGGVTQIDIYGAESPGDAGFIIDFWCAISVIGTPL
jgi:hypothetical protein